MRVAPAASSSSSSSPPWDVDQTRSAFRKVRDVLATLDGHVSAPAGASGSLTIDRFDACAKQVRVVTAQLGGDATLNKLCASVPAQASDHVNTLLDQMRLMLLAPSPSRLDKVAVTRKSAFDALDAMEAILSRVAVKSRPDQGGALSSSMSRLALDSRRAPATARTAEDIAVPPSRTSPMAPRPPASLATAATVRAARATADACTSSAPLLHALVAAGDADALAESATLLEVDWLDQHGRTALHVAASLGNLVCTHVLVRAGANVDLLDGMQCTALLVAASKCHWPVCEALLDAAADPTLRGASVQAQPIDYLYDVNPSSADELRLLGLFFDAGVDVNHTMKYGDTFLHVAAKHNNVALARMLLARPTARVDVANRKGEKPIDLATGHAEMVRVLMMKGAKRTATSPPPVRK